MYRHAIPFPTAPGKTEADTKSIAAYFAAHPAQHQESRKRLGFMVERVYHQATPMGNVVVAYVESERPFVETIQSLVASDLDLDRTFVDMVAEIHGVDLRQPPAGPPPETIGEWVDPQVTTRRKGLAFITPLLPGKLDEATTFAREAFEARKADHTVSRRAFDLNLEVLTLNSNPMGDFFCVYLEGTDPVEANRRFAASTRPYDVWFKDRLKTLVPPDIDFNQPLPPVDQIFDYVREPVLV